MDEKQTRRLYVYITFLASFIRNNYSYVYIHRRHTFYTKRLPSFQSHYRGRPILYCSPNVCFRFGFDVIWPFKNHTVDASSIILYLTAGTREPDVRYKHARNDIVSYKTLLISCISFVEYVNDILCQISKTNISLNNIR